MTWPSDRWLITAAAAVVLIILILATVLFCSERARFRKEAAGRSFAEARTGAATDASAVRDRADTRTAHIDDTVKGATDDVRKAHDIAAARVAARSGVCRIDPSACPD